MLRWELISSTAVQSGKIRKSVFRKPTVFMRLSTSHWDSSSMVAKLYHVAVEVLRQLLEMKCWFPDKNFPNLQLRTSVRIIVHGSKRRACIQSFALQKSWVSVLHCLEKTSILASTHKNLLVPFSTLLPIRSQLSCTSWTWSNFHLPTHRICRPALKILTNPLNWASNLWLVKFCPLLEWEVRGLKL